MLQHKKNLNSRPLQIVLVAMSGFTFAMRIGLVIVTVMVPLKLMLTVKVILTVKVKMMVKV